MDTIADIFKYMAINLKDLILDLNNCNLGENEESLKYLIEGL